MKERLSVSVDAELVAEGKAAVAAGQHESLSSWVSAALRAQSAHDRRLRAMNAWVAEYEAEYGEITEEMMDAADRELRARAITVTFPDDEPLIEEKEAEETTERPAGNVRRSA